MTKHPNNGLCVLLSCSVWYSLKTQPDRNWCCIDVEGLELCEPQSMLVRERGTLVSLGQGFNSLILLRELQKLQVIFRWPWTYEMIRSGPGSWPWGFFIILKRLSVGLPSVIIWNQKMWISYLYDGTSDQYSFVVRPGQRGASNGILWIILRMLTPSWSTHPPILSLFYFLEISIFTGKWKLQLAYGIYWSLEKVYYD